MERSPYYPIYLNISNQLCVVTGGGKVADRKTKGLLAAGARVRLISPELRTKGLQQLFEEGSIEWIPRKYQPGDLQDACLAFAATDDPVANALMQKEGKLERVLVNQADAPQNSDFILPAVFYRDPLQVSVSTGGRVPFAARLIKEELSDIFDTHYILLLQMFGDIRQQLLQRPGHTHKVRALQALFTAQKEWYLHRLRAGETPEALMLRIMSSVMEREME